MDRFEQKIISAYLRHRNACITRLTPKTQIESLLRIIHPVVGGHRLIRMGAKADGGYLIPDDLGGVKACFSPGVGNEVSFES